MDKDTLKLVSGGAASEMRKALENLSAVLDESGSSVRNVVKTTIFVKDLNDYAIVNDEYKRSKKLNST